MERTLDRLGRVSRIRHTLHGVDAALKMQAFDGIERAFRSEKGPGFGQPLIRRIGGGGGQRGHHSKDSESIKTTDGHTG